MDYTDGQRLDWLDHCTGLAFIYLNIVFLQNGDTCVAVTT